VELINQKRDAKGIDALNYGLEELTKLSVELDKEEQPRISKACLMVFEAIKTSIIEAEVILHIPDYDKRSEYSV
jgi:DNA repair ATPase RecN